MNDAANGFSPAPESPEPQLLVTKSVNCGNQSVVRSAAQTVPAARHLTVLFRRNPAGDGTRERIRYEGYRIFWPDGQPVAAGVDRFCQQGCRLLGLGRWMKDLTEQLVELITYPVDGLDAPLTRTEPGVRCRRFYLERNARRARMFFFNGSPTDIEFDAEEDDPRVVEWLGLSTLEDGERLWFDLSARSLPSLSVSC